MIALLYGLWPSWQTLLVVPRIILFSINGVSIGIVNGGGSAGGEHLAIVGGNALTDEPEAEPNTLTPGWRKVALRSSSSQVLPAMASGLSVATQGDLQSVAARLLAAAKPRLAWARCSLKRPSGSRNASAEPSLESLSTTIASKSARLCAASADAILQQWAGIVIDDDHAHPGRGTLNHLALHQLPLAYSLQE